MPRYYAVSISKLIDLFSEEEGPEIATIITESGELDPPKENIFSMAATSFGYLEGIRLGRVIPYLSSFDSSGLKTTKIGNQVFWTTPLRSKDISPSLPS